MARVGVVVQDELIGETIIDLEDRFFHPKWQEWGVTAKRAKEVSQRGHFLCVLRHKQEVAA